MPTDYAEVIDRFGNRRRLRKGESLGTIPDGSRISFPMTMMDSASSSAIDGLGYEAGHRPGHVYAVDDQQLRDRAAQARDQYLARITDAWRTNRQQADAKPVYDAAQAPSLAYEDKKQRLANAWRNR